jgi:hypothetical protein
MFRLTKVLARWLRGFSLADVVTTGLVMLAVTALGVMVARQIAVWFGWIELDSR